LTARKMKCSSAPSSHPLFSHPPKPPSFIYSLSLSVLVPYFVSLSCPKTLFHDISQNRNYNLSICKLLSELRCIVITFRPIRVTRDRIYSVQTLACYIQNIAILRM
jgi:hypothetical protein